MGLATKGYRILREDGPFTFALKGTRFAIGKAKAQTYKIGSGRTCPVCEFSGREFMPAGTPPRQESQCPICRARERHRLLWYYIENETSLSDGGNDILYFAPTNQIKDKLEKSGNNLTTTDLMMNNVDVKADITQLPFDSRTFDAIICSHVLEHIPDDRSAMSEMSRVLASDGDALIMVPKDKDREHTYEDDSITSPEGRRREFGQEDHVRWYGRDFDKRLSQSGFHCSIETYSEGFDSEIVDRYGLRVYDQHLDRVKYEDIHHCTKAKN